jgi:type IX secretion system PorP/SprF family membrane protein
MKKVTIVLLITLGFEFNSFSQGGLDPVFSQYYANALYLNPALAGSHICPRIKLIRRVQWPGIPISYTSNFLSFDMFHLKMNAGVGATFFYESLGDGILTDYAFTLTYSKKIPITSNWAISGGLQGGWGQNKINWNKLQFADQLDYNLGFVLPSAVRPPSSTSIQIWDINTGVNLEYRNKLYLGLAGHHLTQPNNGFLKTDNSKLERKYSIYMSYIFELTGLNVAPSPNKRPPSITPSFLYQRQGIFNNFVGGAYYDHYPIIIGLWMRHAIFNTDAVIVLLGFQQESFQIRYSFDYTISKLGYKSTIGAHEVSFTWQFDCPNWRKKRIKEIKCPNISR